ERSACTVSTSAPEARHAAAASSRRAALREQSTRRGRSGASSQASARPMPSEAPVITMAGSLDPPIARLPPYTAAAAEGAIIDLGMYWLLRKLLTIWVRFAIRPEDAIEQLHARANPLCYVLDRRSATDLAVLQNASLAHKLPRPAKR